jgi:hypothetical protein
LLQLSIVTSILEELVGSFIGNVEETWVEKSKDQDCSKGAVEQDQQNEGGNTSLQGQLGHRDQDRELKDLDSDKSG